MDWDSDYIRDFVAAAVEQDRAAGNSTLMALLAGPFDVHARILTKDDLICAGLPLTQRIFRTVAPEMQIALLAHEGQEVRRDDCVLQLRGDAGAILRSKRTALNILEHLSSIATKTRRFAEGVSGTRTKICGPREATPGMHRLEQYAIELGGGRVHNTPSMLLTTNHVRLTGGIKAALDQAHSLLALQMRANSMTAYEAVGERPKVPEADAISIHIEVQDESELREALEAGAEFVILKNARPDQTRHSVQVVRDMRPDVIVEISGAITLADVRAYADAGADYLCCEDLAHRTPRTRFDLLVERRQEK